MTSLAERLRSRNFLRSFNSEVQDNEAKGYPILFIWAISALAVWKSGGGIYEQAALGSLALLEAIHQGIVAGAIKLQDFRQLVSFPSLKEIEESIFESPRR